MVGNQDIPEESLEGPELRLSSQETASEERRRMGEGLDRCGREMEGWNINWCSGGSRARPLDSLERDEWNSDSSGPRRKRRRNQFTEESEDIE